MEPEETRAQESGTEEKRLDTDDEDLDSDEERELENLAREEMCFQQCLTFAAGIVRETRMSRRSRFMNQWTDIEESRRMLRRLVGAFMREFGDGDSQVRLGKGGCQGSDPDLLDKKALKSFIHAMIEAERRVVRVRFENFRANGTTALNHDWDLERIEAQMLKFRENSVWRAQHTFDAKSRRQLLIDHHREKRLLFDCVSLLSDSLNNGRYAFVLLEAALNGAHSGGESPSSSLGSEQYGEAGLQEDPGEADWHSEESDKQPNTESEADENEDPNSHTPSQKRKRELGGSTCEEERERCQLDSDQDTDTVKKTKNLRGNDTDPESENDQGNYSNKENFNDQRANTNQ